MFFKIFLCQHFIDLIKLPIKIGLVIFSGTITMTLTLGFLCVISSILITLIFMLCFACVVIWNIIIMIPPTLDFICVYISYIIIIIILILCTMFHLCQNFIHKNINIHTRVSLWPHAINYNIVITNTRFYVSVFHALLNC